MNRSVLLVSVACLGIVAWGCAAPHGHFGEPMKHEGQKPLTVGHVLSNPQQYDGQFVRVAGTVEAVCGTAGCWMEIADQPGDKPLFVKLAMDTSKGRMPPEAKGHKAIAEGTVKVVEFSEAQRKHFAEAAGQSPAEIGKIKGPEQRVQLVSKAASVQGIKPAEPKTCEHGGE